MFRKNARKLTSDKGYVVVIHNCGQEHNQLTHNKLHNYGQQNETGCPQRSPKAAEFLVVGKKP
jgi:hypothetical protein